MRLRRTVGVFVSGVVVYGVVAACSSSPSSSGMGARADGGLVGTIVQDAKAALDAIVSPTPEASAGSDDAGGTPGPTVTTVPCSGSFDAGGDGEYVYAEQAYPGMTAVQLSAVRILINYPAGYPQLFPPGGYSSLAGAPWVRDGAAAVLCGPASSASGVTVTFILPAN